jgi:hypothetical protein
MAWRSIVFIQNPEEGTPAADWLGDAWQGDDDSLVSYLSDFDCDGAGEVTEGEPWGTSDHTFEHGPYVVAYNRNLEYVSLNQKES